MRTKKIILLLTALLLIAAPAGFLSAQYDVTAMQEDMASVVDGLSGLFGESLGGMSYIGEPVGYSFIRHLAIGVAGGAVLVPTKNLSFAEGTSMDIDFGDLAYIPIPVVGAYGKLSIKKLEFGVRIAGFPAYTSEDLEIKNMIIGGKIRYNLGGFNLLIIKGGASVGVLYEYMKGGILVAQSEGFPISNPVYGEIGTAKTTAAIDTSWKSSTVGGEAQANFQLLFLNLFVGTRLSKTFGKATSEFTGTVDLVENPDNPGYVTTAQNEEVSTSSETKAKGIDIYGFGGAEVKLFILSIGARGSYNFSNNSITVDGGVRLQF